MSIVHEAECAQCGKRQTARHETMTKGYAITGSGTISDEIDTYHYPEGWITVQPVRKGISAVASVVCSWRCAEVLCGNEGKIVRGQEH
jgi:hypothetical protein